MWIPGTGETPLVSFFSYLSWLQIVLLMVALMSGILSIIREYVLITKHDAIPEKKLFWTSVRVAFIISAIALWATEHHSVLNLKGDIQRLSKPQFSMMVGGLYSIYRSDQGRTLVFPEVDLINGGADSSVFKFEAHYHSNTLDQDIPVVHVIGTAIFDLGKGLSYTFKEDEDSLIKKVIPIVPRGSVIAARLPLAIPGNRVDELGDGKTQIKITVYDYLNQSSSVVWQGTKTYKGMLLPRESPTQSTTRKR